MVVVGIDVGGARKGFHAVAFRHGRYSEHYASRDPGSVAHWCELLDARAVGVDAPCRWSQNGRARRAEVELMRDGISCFSTPTEATARQHPRDHFGWMINGMGLYTALSRHYRLLEEPASQSEPVCFETFPHAIACSLAEAVVTAKKKSLTRRALLYKQGIDASKLRNIDYVDAALCALTAQRLVGQRYKLYGEPVEGCIFVPCA